MRTCPRCAKKVEQVNGAGVCPMCAIDDVNDRRSEQRTEKILQAIDRLTDELRTLGTIIRNR